MDCAGAFYRRDNQLGLRHLRIGGRLAFDGSLLLLLVPIYTAVWYVIRAVQLIRAAKMTASPLVMTLTSSLPFWAASVFWSWKTYLSLPDHLDGCFIVTAASRGHQKIVGPFAPVQHRGQTRLANQQLATFWQFEFLWCNHSPRSHAAFRCVYNKIGPVIARNITQPWLADAVYIALKPTEFFARHWIRFTVNKATICGAHGVTRPTIVGHSSPLLESYFGNDSEFSNKERAL